jgi:transposase
METQQSRKRRRYSAQLKAQILAECDVPGASVAKVAMAHAINANIVHGWRKLARQGDVATGLVQREFVPVALRRRPRLAPLMRTSRSNCAEAP